MAFEFETGELAESVQVLVDMLEEMWNWLDVLVGVSGDRLKELLADMSGELQVSL